MNRLIIFVLLACIGVSSFARNDGEDGTKLSLWIPGFLVKMAAGIAEEHTDELDASMLKHIGSISIFVREGDAYNGSYDRKAARKVRRLDKRNFEDLVTVYEESTQVHIKLKENKRGVVKRLAVLVDDKEETFVFVKINCRLTPDEINQLVNSYMN